MIGRFSSWYITDRHDPLTVSLKYVLDGGKQIVGSHDGTHWVFTTTDRDLRHGAVNADLIVTRLSDGAEALVRTICIRFFSADADRRSHAQIMVAKIESILENRADSDVETYTIKSRSITKMSVKELMDWREYYLGEAARGSGRNTVRVGFV